MTGTVHLIIFFILLLRLIFSTTTGLVFTSVSLAVEGRVSLVGEHCPGTVRLLCEGVDLTILTWSYNGEDRHVIHSFAPDDTITAPIHLSLESPFQYVQLTHASRSLADQRFGNFSSVLTVELSRLQEHNVTDITCGDPEIYQSLNVNVTIKEPEESQLITVNTTDNPKGIIITWTPSTDCQTDYMITVIIANSIVTKWVNGTTCSMKCQTVVELPVSRGETSCYFLTIKARNTKGDSFSVFHDYLLSVTEDLMLCDTPESTANGRLINYDNSSSNSLRLGTNVSYQCNDGLIPNEEKISTCSNVLGEAKWIPDPSQFVCRKREDSVKEISLTINQVAVICTTVTFIVAMVSGCAGGALLTYWVMRKKTVFSPAAEGQINVGPTVPADPIYEEVSPKEKIEMNTNQAYGPCSVNL